MKEININNKTRGIIVFAKRHEGDTIGEDWIVLIAHAKYCGNGFYAIRRVASYALTSGTFYCDDRPGNWGNTLNYTFYEATIDQKKLILHKIRREGYRYIGFLNKLVKIRKNRNGCAT